MLPWPRPATRRRAFSVGVGALLGVPVAVKDKVDVAGEGHLLWHAAVSRRADEMPSHTASARAGAIVLERRPCPSSALWTQFTASATWAHAEPPDLSLLLRRFERRISRSCCPGMVGAGDWIGWRWLDPRTRRMLWRRWPQAPARPHPVHSQREHWHGLSVLGPMARNRDDAALMFDTIANPNRLAANEETT